MLARGSETEGTLLTVMRGRVTLAARVLASVSGDDGVLLRHKHCIHSQQTDSAARFVVLRTYTCTYDQVLVTNYLLPREFLLYRKPDDRLCMLFAILDLLHIDCLYLCIFVMIEFNADHISYHSCCKLLGTCTWPILSST